MRQNGDVRYFRVPLEYASDSSRDAYGGGFGE